MARRSDGSRRNPSGRGSASFPLAYGTLGENFPEAALSPSGAAALKVHAPLSLMATGGVPNLLEGNVIACQESPIRNGAGAVIDETFLAQHRATLERHQDGWVLRYPIQGPSIYGERSFNHPIESTLPLVGETREDALQIAELSYEITSRP